MLKNYLILIENYLYLVQQGKKMSRSAWMENHSGHGL